MEQIPLNHWLIVSTLLFFIGTYGFLTRRNLLTMLISVELMLNAVNINFVAFNYYLHGGALEGMFFSLFIITVAAAEVAIAIAIFVNLYRHFNGIDIEQVKQLKF